MKIQKRTRNQISSLLLAIFLVGFTGKEQFVELDGYLNGRSSATFLAQNRNILNVLSKGTRGEIVEHKKLPSGNYGIRIRVINGPHKGKVFWVYHNTRRSNLKLFETAPQSWGVNPPTTRTVTSVEAAKGVETQADVQAREDNTPVASTPRVATVAATTAPASNLRASTATAATATQAVEIIHRTNTTVQNANDLNCYNCTTAPVSGQRSIVRPGAKRMSAACGALMDGNGQLGAHGQSIYNIMAEPQYQRLFTANNALGQFCPKFNQLSTQEKLMAWTWFWTSLASEESSCNPTVRHATHYKDRNGKVRILNPVEGYGLWAMERDRNVRRWRGSACSDISTVANQARCSIDIMASTQLSKGRTAGINNMSYWGPVRRGNTQIIPHMRRLSLCF